MPNARGGVFDRRRSRALILVVLPSHESLLREYKTNGCVKIQISAQAYESEDALRSVVEYRYSIVAADEKLSHSLKLLAGLLGVIIVPGLLLFVWLWINYKANGYYQQAHELRLWFFIGVFSWIMIITCTLIFSALLN